MFNLIKLFRKRYLVAGYRIIYLVPVHEFPHLLMLYDR